jgi:hypothetical protein
VLEETRSEHWHKLLLASFLARSRLCADKRTAECNLNTKIEVVPSKIGLR